MEKEVYTAPETEITVFETQDVIQASGGGIEDNELD